MVLANLIYLWVVLTLIYLGFNSEIVSTGVFGLIIVTSTTLLMYRTIKLEMKEQDNE